jgi:hypothetical protein
MSLRRPEPPGNAPGKSSRRSGGLKDTAGVTVSPPVRKTIDSEGRVVKDAVRKALQERQTALAGLMHAIREYRKLSDQRFALRGSEYAQAVQELNKAIGCAQEILQ